MRCNFFYNGIMKKIFLVSGLVTMIFVLSLSYTSASAEIPDRIESGQHHIEKLSEKFHNVFIEEDGVLDLYLNRNQWQELRPFNLTGTMINYGKVIIRGALNNQGFIENWGTIDALVLVNENEHSKLNNWGLLKTITPVITKQGTFNNCGDYNNWFLEENPIEAQIIQVKPPETNCALQGAISMWNADSTQNDIVGNNHGGSATIEYGPGLKGEAFSFSGEQKINIGNTEDLKITQDITLEAWVNTDDLEEGQFAPILTKWAQEPTLDSYGITLWKRNNVIQFAGAVVTPTGMAGLVNGRITPNTWTHVAMTYNGSNGDHRIFVDGEEVAWQSKPGGIVTTDLDVIIGSEDAKEPRYFFGLIDEPAIYNQTLSGEEIRTNMQVGIVSAPSRGDFDFFDDLDIPPPLVQQRYLEIPAEKVTCEDDRQLMITPTTGRPACINLNHVEKLIERGWIEGEDFDPISRGGGGGGLVGSKIILD